MENLFGKILEISLSVSVLLFALWQMIKLLNTKEAQMKHLIEKLTEKYENFIKQQTEVLIQVSKELIKLTEVVNDLKEDVKELKKR